MKKVLVIALMLGAGLAYASSIGVPWFVDNGATGSSPPAKSGSFGAIYIHSNATATLECSIEYFTSAGVAIGPFVDNTFIIEPNASIGFRPVKDDSLMEAAAARAVPNRPLGTDGGNDNKKNGSCVISWLGPADYVQGAYLEYGSVQHRISLADTNLIYKLQGYGHLLPPGV